MHSAKKMKLSLIMALMTAVIVAAASLYAEDKEDAECKVPAKKVKEQTKKDQGDNKGKGTATVQAPKK